MSIILLLFLALFAMATLATLALAVGILIYAVRQRTQPAMGTEPPRDPLLTEHSRQPSPSQPSSPTRQAGAAPFPGAEVPRVRAAGDASIPTPTPAPPRFLEDRPPMLPPPEPTPALPAPTDAPTPTARDEAMLERRAERAAERLLDDEGLVADLEDEAATTLLDWGVAMATRLVDETAGLDDEAADALIQSRLQATRQILRQTSAFAIKAPTLNPTERQVTLSAILAHAATIGLSAESAPRTLAAAPSQPNFDASPAELIAQVRALVEGSSATDGGG